MRIMNANVFAAKDELSHLIAKINHPRTPQQVNEWLVLNLGTDLFNAWVAYEKDEPVGMIAGEVVEYEGPSVYIAFNWVKPGVGVNKELVQRIEDWAKEMEATKLLFYTRRSPRTFIKKYGFEIVRSVLKKDI